MKITRDTPEQLIVEDRPWLIAAFILALTLGLLAICLPDALQGKLPAQVGAGLCAALGLFLLALFVRRAQVIFHRPENYVQMRHRSVFGQVNVRHTLTEVDRAVLQQLKTESRGSWRVALSIPAGQSKGEHPITQAYLNNKAHCQAIADRINAWLADPATTRNA